MDLTDVLPTGDISAPGRLRLDLDARRRNLAHGLKMLGLELEELARHANSHSPEGELLVSGSIVEGFANPYSDIDIYVVGEGLDHNLLITGFSEIRIDLELWPTNRARTLADRINSAGGYLSDLPYFGMRDLKFTARLFHAVRLLEPAQPFIAKDLGFNRRSVATLLARRHMAFADSMYQDAAGAVEVSDYVYAFLRGREAFTHAVDALLSCYGSLEPEKKHRLSLLARVEQAAGVRDRYVSAQSTWCDESDVPAWARATHDLLGDARRLIACVSRWLDDASMRAGR